MVVLKAQVLPSAVEKDMVVVVLCTQACSPLVGAMLDQEPLPNQALDHGGLWRPLAVA